MAWGQFVPSLPSQSCCPTATPFPPLAISQPLSATQESETLSRFFVEPRFFEHSGGHEFLPADTFLQVVDFLDLAVECCWCGRNSEGIEGIRFHMFSRRAFCNTCWVAYGGPWGYWPNAWQRRWHGGIVSPWNQKCPHSGAPSHPERFYGKRQGFGVGLEW